MEDDILGAPADSPPAAPAEPSGQAPSTPGAPPPAPDANRYVPYERFQQVNSQWRETQRQLADLTQKFQAREARANEPAAPTPSQTERAAAAALKQLIQIDPELAATLKIGQHGERLDKFEKMLASLVDSQHQGRVTGGRKAIADYVARLGLPAESAKQMERTVVGYITDDPDLAERWARGDLSVISDALDDFKKAVLDATRRPQQQAVIDTKARTNRLPPVTRGSGPGQEPPLKLGPNDDPRSFMKALAERARAMAGAAGR